MARRKKSERDKEVDAALDELLKQHRPQDILNEGGLYDQLYWSSDFIADLRPSSPAPPAATISSP